MRKPYQGQLCQRTCKQPQGCSGLFAVPNVPFWPSSAPQLSCSGATPGAEKGHAYTDEELTELAAWLRCFIASAHGVLRIQILFRNPRICCEQSALSYLCPVCPCVMMEALDRDCAACRGVCRPTKAVGRRESATGCGLAVRRLSRKSRLKLSQASSCKLQVFALVL